MFQVIELGLNAGSPKPRAAEQIKPDAPLRPGGRMNIHRRSFVLAIITVSLALLPLSSYGFLIAQDDGMMDSLLLQATDDEQTIQFDLVPAAEAIANCFPGATAKVKVFRNAAEQGTDKLILSGKHLRPNTRFALFLTELPGAPAFGTTQFLANFTTNESGKAFVEVNAIIENAFISQAGDTPRIRKDLNHVVFWFADPADAAACFPPGTPLATPFDGDGLGGPAVMSSKNALPGAPLP